MTARHTAIEKIRSDIAAARIEVFSRIQPAAQIIPSRHKGKKFRRSLRPYLACKKKIRADYAPFIEAIGDRIGALHQRHWPRDKEIVQLWLNLAAFVAQGGEHPNWKKCSGALLIDPNNVLAGFDANRIPEGQESKLRYYAKGVRQNHIVCAERNVINGFNRTPTSASGPSSLVLVVTAPPCIECVAEIVGRKPLISTVIADIKAGKEFTRYASMLLGMQTLTETGIMLGKYDGHRNGQKRLIWHHAP